jgi:hypothetical protein
LTSDLGVGFIEQSTFGDGSHRRSLANCVQGTFSISGNMEGNMPEVPGSPIYAGFTVRIPSAHPAASVTINGTVALTALCPSGARVPVLLPVAGHHNIMLNNVGW